MSVRARRPWQTYPSNPRPAEPSDYSRFDACHMCGAKAGQPCRNLNFNEAGEPLPRAHPERMPKVDRDAAGVMILGRRDHTATSQSRPGTTHGAYAHHAAVDGAAVCSGALLDEGTYSPLPRLENRERCQRPACKRVWRNEEYR